jgi:hypothetical protein
MSDLLNRQRKKQKMTENHLLVQYAKLDFAVAHAVNVPVNYDNVAGCFRKRDDLSDPVVRWQPSRDWNDAMEAARLATTKSVSKFMTALNHALTNATIVDPDWFCVLPMLLAAGEDGPAYVCLAILDMAILEINREWEL